MVSRAFRAEPARGLRQHARAQGAFLDVEGFFAPLLAMMDRMVTERFLHEDQRRDLWHGEELDALFAWMRGYTPARADKWLDEKRRKDLR